MDAICEKSSRDYSQPCGACYPECLGRLTTLLSAKCDGMPFAGTPDYGNSNERE